MPDPEERPVGSLHHSGRLDLAHCFFDLRGCFWSVVHPLAMAGAAKVENSVSSTSWKKKTQLAKLIKMTPRLIFVSTTILLREAGGPWHPIFPSQALQSVAFALSAETAFRPIELFTEKCIANDVRAKFISVCSHPHSIYTATNSLIQLSFVCAEFFPAMGVRIVDP